MRVREEGHPRAAVHGGSRAISSVIKGLAANLMEALLHDLLRNNTCYKYSVTCNEAEQDFTPYLC